MNRPIASTVLLVAATVLAGQAGCGKAETAQPVATATFSPSRTRVALGSPVDLTYRFDVLPGAVISGDYKVFVHVLSDDGQKVWDDDHDPPIPTSEWKPGQTIGPYTRTKFLPLFPYVGHVTVVMGLYKGDSRLPLTTPDPKDKMAMHHEYKVGALELTQSSDNIRIIRMSGWNPAEFAPDNPLLGWEWTQKTAVASFANPKRDVTLYLDSEARAELFQPPQNVTVFSAGQPVYTFPASNVAPVLRRIPITAAQLGTRDMTELRIEVDRTFTPSKLGTGNDPRELGIRLFHVFVEPK